MAVMKNFLLTILAITLLFLSNAGCKPKQDSDISPEPAPREVQKIIEQEFPVDSVKPEGILEPAKLQSDSQVHKPLEPIKTDKKQEPEWTDNYDEAQKKAVAEGKDMLLNFSGSDWCKFCIQLDKEVFDKKDFIEAASKDFVLVTVDFPRDTSILSSETEAQNARLNQRFKESQFPTVFLTDSMGRPYAITGYLDGGVDNYLASLSDLKKTGDAIDDLLKKSRDSLLEGYERAKLVEEALMLVPQQHIPEFYRDQISRIVELDSDNKARLRDKYYDSIVLWEAEDLIAGGNIDGGIKVIDNRIKELGYQGDTAQRMYYFRAIFLDRSNDKQGAYDSLNNAVKALPGSELAGSINNLLGEYFSDFKTQ